MSCRYPMVRYFVEIISQEHTKNWALSVQFFLWKKFDESEKLDILSRYFTICYKMKRLRLKGLTLIEMILVIGIIALLLGLIFPRLQVVQARSRDLARK